MKFFTVEMTDAYVMRAEALSCNYHAKTHFSFHLVFLLNYLIICSPILISCGTNEYMNHIRT